MKGNKWKVIFLTLIIAVAAALRIISLDQFPAGLNADEASIGYNAYSLLQTGKDEYGESFPLSFKSFGDYKPGLYFYFVAPFVGVLGLNEWAVRLPSAIFGVIGVFGIFLLGRKIFNTQVGLASAAILAISPWHLHFSRGGWETNVATTFIIFGIYWFILGLEKNKFFIWSMVAFLASMYTYQSPRLIVPILVLTLAILYKNQLLVSFKKKIKSKNGVGIFLIVVVLLSILTVPLALQFTGGSGSARFAGLSIFSDSGPASRVNELRGEHSYPEGLTPKLLHNKLTAYGPNFLGHYLDHFRGDFLFINGDPLIRNKVPETGQFYLIFSIFLIFGLINLIWLKNPYKKLLIAWILIAPIASSITYQTPHALRALNMVIPLSLMMGLGAYRIIVWLGSLGWLGKIGIGILSLIIIFEVAHYQESYYVHYPKRYPLSWEYGFSQMVKKLEPLQGNYKKVIITDRYDQPYILVLFFKKYPPQNFQPQAILTERDKFNFGTIRNFDNLEFRSIKKEEVGKTPGVLYVGTTEEIPEGVKIIDKVDFPNGQPAFIFTEGEIL